MRKSADIGENVNLPIKSQLLGKIRHFEIFKNLSSMDIQSRNRVYIQTRFQLKNHHATKINKSEKFS